MRPPLILRLPHSIPALLTALLIPLHAGSLAAAEPSRTKPRNGSPKPAESKAPAKPEADRVQRVAGDARASIVVITQSGRDGKSEGVGTGFAISGDGLVATSLHVIGEGIAMGVQAPDGSALEVVGIHAWDRRYDLAILRIKGTKLPPALPLGDSEAVKPGEEVVAIGNPMGLEHSVVRGVASARREIEGVDMIQVAIPIEPGNSGGPLLDLQGRVLGVMALKSAMTANLGFAVPVSALRRLVERPNPVPMDRWMNIGALPPELWETRLGGRWRQKVDRITVEGAGEGFGGRALCLARKPSPKPSFELTTEVKLGDESGAAGLLFGGDGGDLHYGFYPTGGQLRLTRFDGPNVFSWNILQQGTSEYYKPGEWNRLKVTVEATRIRCFVNDHPLFETTDVKLAGDRVGLCKFRATQAEFRRFGVGQPTALPTNGVSEAFTEALRNYLEKPSRETEKAVASRMEGKHDAARILMDARVATLEREAASLRRLSRQAHARQVESDLRDVLTSGEKEIDLVRAALQVARYDDPDLDVEAYKAHFDHLAADLAGRIQSGADERDRMKALKEFFFGDQGFHGSRHDFGEKANSYLNRVLEQREGLPITLSVLFMELGRRAGLDGLRAHAYPGHFMVVSRRADGSERVIDVFEGGRELTHDEVDLAMGGVSGVGIRSSQVEPARKRDIIVRMVRNLLGIARSAEASQDTLRYLDLILALQPASAAERLERARLRAQLNDSPGAREDVQWLLDHAPAGVDPEKLEQLLKML